MFEQYKSRLKRIYHALRAVFEVRRRIRGSGNRFSYGRCVLRRVVLDIIGDSNTVRIDDGCVVEGLQVRIRGDNHRLHFERGCFVKDTRVFFEDTGGLISIGEHTVLHTTNLSAVEDNQSIRIGARSAIGEGSDMRTSDSHSILDMESGKRLNPPASIRLGDHVWIGKDVRVLKGITIGNNCVVGLGSVVTRDIPDNCVAIGIPAKVLRTGATWDWEKLPC
ncbi:MAG: acyltransferase [Acidobacteriota bacterium]